MAAGKGMGGEREELSGGGVLVDSVGEGSSLSSSDPQPCTPSMGHLG
jgi:hypothetical protein